MPSTMSLLSWWDIHSPSGVSSKSDVDGLMLLVSHRCPSDANLTEVTSTYSLSPSSTVAAARSGLLSMVYSLTNLPSRYS